MLIQEFAHGTPVHQCQTYGTPLTTTLLLSLHKNTTLSQLCHKLQKRTSVKMNLEQKQNNDADSAYSSTSDSSLHCKGEEVWRMGGH